MNNLLKTNYPIIGNLYRAKSQIIFDSNLLRWLISGYKHENKKTNNHGYTITPKHADIMKFVNAVAFNTPMMLLSVKHKVIPCKECDHEIVVRKIGIRKTVKFSDYGAGGDLVHVGQGPWAQADEAHHVNVIRHVDVRRKNPIIKDVHAKQYGPYKFCCSKGQYAYRFIISPEAWQHPFMFPAAFSLQSFKETFTYCGD